MSKIAVLGFGVVGSGTVEVFYKNKENLEQKSGHELDIKYILDKREFPDSPYKDKLVKDFKVILNDKEVDVVAELIGGNTFAYDCVKSALLAGKNVVTSNKELVATKGAELLKIARENNVNFFFEASVGGGIPIIRPLHQCLLTDQIDGIAGILNGTTNFILTKMIKENMSFETALKIAQELGYAERDPSADVEGHDTCRKICILASLAFGQHIYPDNVHTEGITRVTAADMEYAASFDHNIKLIGWTKKIGDRIAIMVCPMLVPEESQLSNVNDVFNAILVRGDATGEVLFYGKGAGKLPTASAVVADIVNATKQLDKTKTLFWEDKSGIENKGLIINHTELKSSFYIRTSGADEATLRALFGSITLLRSINESSEETAFVTQTMSEIDVEDKCKKLNILSKIRVMNF